MPSERPGSNACLTSKAGKFGQRVLNTNGCHIPDAFLTLHLNTASSGNAGRGFFYEAARQTESLPDFAKKLRAYHQFILPNSQHSSVGREITTGSRHQSGRLSQALHPVLVYAVHAVDAGPRASG